MKTTKMLTILALALGLMACWPKTASAAEPVGTAFTYQGHLYDANYAADGLYDFAFKLYDANVGGSKVGTDVNVADVDVIDAYFTVELDFNDVNAFNGDARWLEIGVRPGEMNDPNGYTPLSPRQELTPTPYAIYAQNAGGDNDWMISRNDMYSIPSGNVGIGTTSPSSKLHIEDNTSSSLILTIHNKNDAGSERLYFGTSTGSDAGIIAWGSTNPTYPGKWRFFNNKTSGHYDWITSGSARMTLDNSGNLGIGTTNPQNKLDVEGAMVVGASYSGTETAPSNGMIIQGNVGIGTENPLASLVVAGTGTPMFKIGYKGSYNNAESGRLAFDEDVEASDICGFEFQHDGSANKLYLNGGCTTMTPIVTFLRGGNVGIGTDSPAEKLTVRGNLLIESSDGTDIVELGEGLDYAEGFDVAGSTEIEPGTVLIIDPDNAGKLAVSNTPYDSKVAGIVAGAKGIGSGVRLGAEQFDYDVALAGRVYCNVDATKTAVEAGDLLTTSDTPGYAMKATDYMRAHGAVLGKAMERLQQGQKGQILVLVTLQ